MAEEPVIVVRRPWWRRAVKWGAILLAGVLVLIGGALLLLDTGPGHAFLAQRIAAVRLQSGLNFRIRQIDGSIYGAMVLRDVEVRDSRGRFATAKEMTVDWRPFAYLRNRVDINALTSPEIDLSRMPALEPGPATPNAPTLPNIDIDIARLAVARIDIAPVVTGQRHIASLSGSLHLSDGRAQIVADASTLTAPGVAGGDRLALKLDAVPDRNKLDIAVQLGAPKGGLVAGLTRLDAPLAVLVSGKGSWSNWAGHASSTLGESQLADLAITAQNGSFHVHGPTHPGLYMKGPVERLAAPQLDLALDVAWNDRKADTHLILHSNAAQIDSHGLIDFAASRFGNFRTEATLLTPGAIAPNLRGKGLHIAVALDGPFLKPVVDYKIQAAALGFDTVVVEQLVAEGRTQIVSNRVMIPVRAHAVRVSGLSDAAGGLLVNVSLSGDLALSGTQILSDNLHLKSDRIDATALVVANLRDGSYNGALKGRVNDYRIDGVAMANLTTDARLVAEPGGGWGIKGQIAGRSTKFFSNGVQDFLGGNASLTARVAIDAKGIVSFGGIRLSAPEFRLTDGSGRYAPSGALLVNATGVSQRYGPMTAQVTGTLTAPQVLVHAPRPGLGIGLADLEAQVKGGKTGFSVLAKGGTDYGPFTADLLLASDKAGTVDIRAARFAGMDIKGRIAQLPAGPYAGNLDFAGAGVTGHVLLGGQGKLQRADIDARASNAVIPGAAKLSIGRAIVNGSILFADTPQISGDAQVANLRSGDFVLKTARAKIDYQGGNGTAQLFADGSSGVPFRLAANALLSPKQWLVAVQGVSSHVGFHTASPARIAIERKTYRLLPTQVAFDQGSATIAGSWGVGVTFQARLDKVDLSVVDAISPGLGIGGSATGALDFSQANAATFPQADARLDIAGFTRSSIEAVSTPVDVSFVGKLLPDGGDLRALVRRGGTTIGRAVATLRPLGPEAGSWTERLTAAPLTGGVRYNGPAAVVFSLAGLADQQLTGPIGIAADFSGRVREPQLTGIIRGNNLVYENETYGTRLSNLKVSGNFTSDKFVIDELSATAGSGTVSAKGSVGFSAANDYPIYISADFNNARLARSDSLGATATGKITVTKDATVRKIEGDLRLPQANYEVIRQGAAEVSELTGVRRKGEALQTPQQRAAAASANTYALALRIRADNQVSISGMGLESEWSVDLTVGGTSATPQVTGSATVVRGTYDFAGKRFDIDHGTIRFSGGPLNNPTVDISANTTTQGVTAILNVTGTAQRPQIAFTSTPALSQEEVLSRVLFGSSITNLNATEAIQLAASLNSLRGTGGGLNPLGKLRSALGIDRLTIVSADSTTGQQTALSAGKYITKNIYVEIITDARGYTATQLQIALSRALSILSQTGSFAGSSASVRYSKDY